MPLVFLIHFTEPLHQCHYSVASIEIHSKHSARCTPLYIVHNNQKWSQFRVSEKNGMYCCKHEFRQQTAHIDRNLTHGSIDGSNSQLIEHNKQADCINSKKPFGNSVRKGLIAHWIEQKGQNGCTDEDPQAIWMTCVCVYRNNASICNRLISKHLPIFKVLMFAIGILLPAFKICVKLKCSTITYPLTTTERIS